jgi:DNA polymerase I-like protein with 3'-5' exonuclease and polymerase domains
VKFYALDIETETLVTEKPEYALQPWRVKERYVGNFPKAKISIVSYLDINTGVIEATSGEYDFVTGGYEGQFVFTWNGVFDVAFLIADGVGGCEKVKWLDVMSLYKWAIRSQHTDHPIKKKIFSWSAGNAAKHLLQDWEHYEEFQDIKEEMLSDPDYWLRRCELDVEATLKIGELLWEELTPQQAKSYLIEQEMIYPAALAWVTGCDYDMQGAGKLESSLTEERKDLLEKLQVSEAVLSSPSQLSELVYTTWQVPFDKSYVTPKGKKSVAKGFLTLLIENHAAKFPQLELVRQFRDCKSRYDKFIKGPVKAKEYLGKETFHPCWRINSTYTGRCTVSSKSKKKPTGLPMHQIPKRGDFRKFIKPPKDHYFIVADVDSQETKLMTEFSQDEAFLKIYKEGLNPHAYTASKISGVPYKEIIEGKEHDTRLSTLYKAGKVTNLGENYRMGAKTLWMNAHTQWGLTPLEEEVRHWVKVWRKTYKGVINQWANFVDKARLDGYAETLAGRRFYIDQWQKYKWASESSAIMTPVQGSGADMKYLAIAVMRKRFPGLTFWGEIHDEIIYTAHNSVLHEVLYNEEAKAFESGGYVGDISCVCTKEDALTIICDQVKKTLDNLPFKKAWGWENTVPFTWTVSYGKNWKEQVEV